MLLQPTFPLFSHVFDHVKESMIYSISAGGNTPPPHPRRTPALVCLHSSQMRHKIEDEATWRIKRFHPIMDLPSARSIRVPTDRPILFLGSLVHDMLRRRCCCCLACCLPACCFLPCYLPACCGLFLPTVLSAVSIPVWSNARIFDVFKAGREPLS